MPVSKRKISFEQWMQDIDAEVKRRTGLGYMDLPDAPYRDWYEDGVKASTAAGRAIREDW